MAEVVIKSNIRFLINTKLSELKKDNVINISYDDIEKTLLNTKWKEEIPEHLSIAAQDIKTLTIDEIIDEISKDNLK